MFVPIRSVVTEEKSLSLQFSEMLDRAPVGSPTYMPLCSLAGAQTNSTALLNSRESCPSSAFVDVRNLTVQAVLTCLVSR
jgi:hypothetical protein